MKKKIIGKISAILIAMLLSATVLLAAGTVNAQDLDREDEINDNEICDCSNSVSSTQTITERGFFSIVQISYCLCGEVARLDYYGSPVCYLSGLNIGELLLYMGKYVEVTGYLVDCPLCYVLEVESITEIPLCSDVNGDRTVDIGDVVYLINYLFRSGPEPQPELCLGDVTADGIINIGDVVYLINYLFRGGPAPSPDCCG